jgi:hypothetical protein
VGHGAKPVSPKLTPFGDSCKPSGTLETGDGDRGW